MMTEAQKRAQKRYIEKNKETFNAKQRVLALDYYYKNKLAILAKKKLEYQNKKNKNLEPII
jgi:hypothetical protein